MIYLALSFTVLAAEFAGLYALTRSWRLPLLFVAVYATLTAALTVAVVQFINSGIGQCAIAYYL